MFTSLVLNAFSDCIFDDDRVGQEELLFVKVRYLRLWSVTLILEETLFIESVVDGLYVFLDWYYDVTLRFFILCMDCFVEVFVKFILVSQLNSSRCHRLLYYTE